MFQEKHTQVLYHSQKNGSQPYANKQNSLFIILKYIMISFFFEFCRIAEIHISTKKHAEIECAQNKITNIKPYIYENNFRSIKHRKSN